MVNRDGEPNLKERKIKRREKPEVQQGPLMCWGKSFRESDKNWA